MLVRELNKEEMMHIDGGSISSSFINAIAKIVNALYEIGEATGSAIRRLTSGSYCSTN